MRREQARATSLLTFGVSKKSKLRTYLRYLANSSATGTRRVQGQTATDRLTGLVLAENIDMRCTFRITDLLVAFLERFCFQALPLRTKNENTPIVRHS